MTTQKDRMLTVGEIATTLEVEQPTVSNWRRRHPDFPLPNTTDGQQLFSARELASWLNRRPIPAKSLKQHESPGSTYGDRLRARIAGPILDTSRKNDQAVIRTILGSYGDRPYRDEMDYLALLLFYLKTVGGQAWTQIVEHSEEPNLLSQRIGAAASENLGPTAWSLVANLPRMIEDTAAMSRIVRTIDQSVPTVGHGDIELQRQVGIVFSALIAHIAEARGRHVGSFLTPRSISNLAVELLRPGCGDSVHDPHCGSGEFLTEAADYLAEAGCTLLSLSGHTQSGWLYLLTTMSLNLRGIDASIGTDAWRTLADGPKEARFDIVLTNPPFNTSYDLETRPEWTWPFGVPPKHNTNFGWLQHAFSLLAPNGRAAVVMSPSAAFSINPRELAVRTRMVEAGVVEAIVALPDRLFYGTSIPAHLWILTREQRRLTKPILFLDATNLGSIASRRHRVLGRQEIAHLKDQFLSWRDQRPDRPVGRIDDIAVSVSIDELRGRRFDLNPRAHVSQPIPQSSLVESRRSIAWMQEQLQHLHARASEVDADVDRRLKETMRGLTDR